ncbi:MAG TPA: hypothetical protein DET40_08705 [Lentisphaeria bacterium]|nr:MAG: hypothetical protein A2X45_19380 [Lentisphaerae bacterium GWF2_50_93]HCE43615.1 hypothetical protein [Lentisphaeria bacterium]
MAATRKSKKNNPATLPGFWKSIKELAPVYLEKYPKVAKKQKELMEIFLDEVNSSQIPSLVYENFILPYFREKEMKISFAGEEKGVLGKWSVKISSEQNILKIDPIGLYMFADEFAKAAEKAKKAEKDGNFLKLRLFSFHKELLKLPEQYLLFLAVLKEVAIHSQIYAVDSKGAFSNNEAAEYFSLLWALKQFEDFYLKVQIRNLRSDYGFIWHEGEWIDASR